MKNTYISDLEDEVIALKDLVRHYETNKRLFEAAPEMLEALKGLTGHTGFYYQKFLVQGMKAIEKAEGIK